MEALEQIKRELEQFGEQNDAVMEARKDKMLNITRDTGEFLAVMIRATAAKRILELGTSNGYSTLWLAEAARAVGGLVTTIDYSEFKIGLAKNNFTRAGLTSYIAQIHSDAGDALKSLTPESFDLIFLDALRSEYCKWWPDIRRVLRSGGLLIVDNATSHPEEMAPFVADVHCDNNFTTCIVPVGKGEFLATKA